MRKGTHTGPQTRGPLFQGEWQNVLQVRIRALAAQRRELTPGTLAGLEILPAGSSPASPTPS